jgi:outer membrane protein assembly factor BamD (BamD/ComL family)
MEREFQMGVALLAGYKIPLLKIFRVKGYDEGVKTMEKLADRAGNAPIAQQSLIAVARHYEKRRKFREAYDTWADIGSRWPTGELGKESLLNMARDMHSSYRGPRYDASGQPTAKGYYETFKMRYPEDARAIGVDAIITQITEQMAYKQLSIAKYYERTKSKTAATLYYDLVAADYKGTSSGQAAQAKIEAQKQ